MRRRRNWVIAFFVLVALTIAAALSMNGRKPVRVRVMSPATGRVEEIVTSNSVGTVEPLKTAVVAAEISGRIVRILVRHGAIKSGQPVFELDARDLQAEREVTRREIDTSRMRGEQAVLRKKKVHEDIERLKGVDVPQSDVQRLKSDFDIARKDEEISALTIRALEAQLEVLDLRLRKTRVDAPFDGTVVQLQSEEGESVTPGKPLFTIHSSGPLLIRAPIDEVDMGRLALGLTAHVTFDAYPDEDFEGVIHEIMPSASTDRKNNRTVDVKIRIPSMPSNVRAGMSANIEVVVRATDGVLYLPTHLIHDDRAGRTSYVYVIDRGIARRRTVRAGYSNWKTTEVAEGIASGDRVIVPLQFENEQTVQEGVPVLVVENGK